MTTARAEAPAKGDGILIHNLLSRGQFPDAQVLLALVSTPHPLGADEDVWVAIGRTEPVPIPTGSWDSIECARPITMSELERLDLDWSKESGSLPFGLTQAAERRYWLTRFDLSDHPSLADRWARFVKPEDTRTVATLAVVAWRARLAAKPDEPRRHVHEPIGAHATLSLAAAELVYQPDFELGVLLVHGIGDHAVRDTLVHWAEAIVKFWDDRWQRITAESRADMPATERSRLARWVIEHQLRNRVPVDGITQRLSDFSSNDERAAEESGPFSRPPTRDPRLCCAVSRIEQTLFPGDVAGQPSASLLRLSTLDTSAVLRESHALFAEAYWTRETFLPTFGELRHWLTSAVPIEVWARLQGLVSSRIHALRLEWQKRPGPFSILRRILSGLLLLVQMATMPPLYLLFALSAQLGIALVGVVGLLPIPWLRSATRWVVTALLGTVGQSFALQTSPIRRSAIVSAVAKNLDWLSARCHRVVVLSHSQGAEISRLVFLDSRRNNVARWYTFGAGIAPLSMLEPRSLQRRDSRAVIASFNALVAIVALTLGAVVLDLIPGTHLGVRDWIGGVSHRLGWTGVAEIFIWLDLVLVVWICSSDGPEVRPQLRRSLMKNWHDFYASHDPVSGGSLIDRFAAEMQKLGIPVPSQSAIFNTRFTLLDHTAYFRNVEQFVAPIALDLLRVMGLRTDPAQEQGPLNEAGRRRDLLTWWNMLISVSGLSICAAILGWKAFGASQRGWYYVNHVGALWSEDSGFWERLARWWRSGLVGQLLADLRPILVILTLMVAWWIVRFSILSRWSQRRLVRDLARAARSATETVR